MDYTHGEQLAFVDKLIDYTNSLEKLEDARYACEHETYPVKEPEVPVKRKVPEPKYPEPEIPMLDTSDNKTLCKSLFMTFAIPTAGIGYFLDRSQRKKDAMKSPEYQALIAPIKAKYEAECQAAEQEYAEALKTRASDLIKWSEGKAEWEAKHSEERAMYYASLKAIRKERRALLDEYKLISDNYISLSALLEIRDFMTQTNSCIKDAVEWLDRQALIAAENRRIAEERKANAIYENHLAAQRDRETALYERQVEAMEKANRIAVAQGVVNTVQNHNRNKIMKKW